MYSLGMELPTITEQGVPGTIVEHLSDIVNQYLANHPRITLNGLSKRCRVSEPTLRRIAKKNIKTEPNKGTILDLLTTISRESDVGRLIEKYEGPIAEYLKKAFPFIQQQQTEYSSFLNSQLSDPLKYTIFTLALNKSGVTKEKIQQMFGDFGIKELECLVEKEIIFEKRPNVYSTKVKHHCGSLGNDFVNNFKTVANFIKPHKVHCDRNLNPLFLNATESVSPETYDAVIKVQKAALAKIRTLVANDSGNGKIPFFLLSAIDTLDLKSAYEIANDSSD